MNKSNDLPLSIDADDIGCNDSPNPDFSSVLNARMSRRTMLRAGAASAAGVASISANAREWRHHHAAAPGI